MSAAVDRYDLLRWTIREVEKQGAGEIIVAADTRRAELEREEKAQRPKHTGVSNPHDNPLPKAKLVAESKRKPLLELSEEDSCPACVAFDLAERAAITGAEMPEHSVSKTACSCEGAA